MRTKEAAYIIGSLGGRPLKYPVHYKNKGGGQGGLVNWILITGFWQDVNVWIDTQVWID